MFLFRMLAGISAAFTAPQVWASIPAVMPPSRIARTMGVAFGGLAAAQALGVPIGSWLAEAGWSIPFWTIGIASMALAAAAFILLPDMRPSAPSAGGTSIFRRYAPLMMSGRARTGFLAYLLLHLGSGTAFAFVGRWMADQFELAVGQIGTVMMFLGFGTLIGSIVSSYTVRKLGLIPAVTAGMLLLAILYSVVPRLTNLPLVTSLYLLMFAVLGIIFPIAMGALTSLNASIRGTISSLANSTMNGANTLGAWIAGVLYVQYGGYSSIGLFSAVCLALSLLAFRMGGVLESGAANAGGETASAASSNR
jgi:predicted MFS family arabinose efflux permease